MKNKFILQLQNLFKLSHSSKAKHNIGPQLHSINNNSNKENYLFGGLLVDRVCAIPVNQCLPFLLSHSERLKYVVGARRPPKKPHLKQRHTPRVPLQFKGSKNVT